MTGRRAAFGAAAAVGLSVALVPTAASAHTDRPGEPTGLHVIRVTATSFTVATHAAPHAQKYRLFASTTRSDLFVQNIHNAQHSGLASAPRVSIGGLTGGSTPYYYRVEALNGSRWKFSGTIGEVGLRPEAPSNLRASSARGSSYMSWSPSATASGYSVEQATNSSMTANKTTYTIEGNNTQFTPYSLHPGQTYYYRVRALNASTPSSYSSTTSLVARSRQQHVSVMTYNIKEARFDGQHEGGNVVAPWSQRKPAAAALIKQGNPDIVGIEEGASKIGRGKFAPRQVDTLKAALGGEYGLARTEVPPKGQGTRRTGDYILYKKADYKTVGKGGHWALGDSRFAAHQILKNRQTGARFLFTVAHELPASGRAADIKRKHETQKLVSNGHALAARHGVPVVYVGDFNSDTFAHHAFNAPAQVMKSHGIEDSFNVAQQKKNARFNTANHYQRRPPHVGARIDYVFAPAGVGVKSWKLIMKLHHGDFVGTIPSDHNPLVSQLSFPY